MNKVDLRFIGSLFFIMYLLFFQGNGSIIKADTNTTIFRIQEGGGDTLSLTDNIKILNDFEGNIKIEDILSGNFSDRFKQTTKYAPNAKACWVKFEVENRRKNSQYYIQVFPHVVFEVYKIISKDSFIVKKHGSDISLYEKDNIKDRSLVAFDINNDKLETYYIRTDLTQISVIREKEIKVNIIDQKSTESTFFFHAIETSFILGVLLVMAIYNFFLFFFVHDRSYIFYSLSLFFLGMFQLSSFSILNHQAGTLSAILGLFVFLHFTKHYLKAPEMFPQWNRFLNYFQTLYLPIIILEYTPYFKLSKWFTNIVFLITLLLLVVFALHAFSKKLRPAKFYVFTICFFLVLMIVLIMSKEYLNILPFDNYFIRRGPYYGAVIQMVLFSIALGTGIDTMREELNQKKIESAKFETIRLQEIQRITEMKNQELNSQNLTIQKQNKELEQTNAKLLYLSAVASETENGVAIIKRDGIVEWTNNRYHQHHENTYKNGELHIEKEYKVLGIMNKFRECEKNHQAYTFEYNHISHSKNIWLLVTITPLFRNAELVNFIAIETDITRNKQYESELKNAKEKAEEADRLKSSFLANISHEIRTPMNAILGFSDLLVSSNPDEEKKERYNNIIQSNGQDLLNLINDIIDISMIESNQIKINKKKFDINQVLLMLKDTYQTQVQDQKKSIEIRMRAFEQQHLFLDSDKFRIKQILINLINNSIKFTHSGYVEFGYRIIRKDIVFFVSDTGIGIKEEEIEKIFQPFYKSDNTSRALYGGVGLGLTISSQLVKLLSGRLDVSTVLGKGTTISFEIPNIVTAEKSNYEVSENIVTDIVWKQKTILVAEDEDTSFQLTYEILKESKSTVVRAHNGMEAVELCKTQNFDIVLMDIRMPIMNGYEAIAKIRDFSDIPIVALTAHALSTDKNRIMQAGFNGYVTKPLNKKMLFNYLSNYLS